MPEQRRIESAQPYLQLDVKAVMVTEGLKHVVAVELSLRCRTFMCARIPSSSKLTIAPSVRLSCPTTIACLISGLQHSASSIGCGLTFSPPAMTIVSFARPVSTSWPAIAVPRGIRRPMSPAVRAHASVLAADTG